MIGDNRNIAKGSSSAATIVLTDGSAAIDLAMVSTNSLVKIWDMYAYSGVTLTLTDGSAFAQVFTSSPLLRTYIDHYVVFTDSSGYQIKGWIKENAGDYGVNIVSTFQGSTYNWAYKHPSFNSGETPYAYEIWTPYIGTRKKGSRVIILDSSSRMIMGYVGDNTSYTNVKIVSTKGGSTQNWAYKHGSFDAEGSPFSVTFDETSNPILMASGSVTRNNCRLNLLNNFDPYALLNGVDLTGYRDGRYMIIIADSSGYQVNGFISNVVALDDGAKLELSSGSIGKWALMEISACEENHFYTGCSVGEFFISEGTETFDANNKAYWWYVAPSTSCKITQSKRYVLESQLPKGIACWLKGDTFELNDGVAVSSWNDSSLNGHNFVNDAEATQPVFYKLTYMLNQKGIVYFNSDFLNNTSLGGLGSDFSVFMVLTQATGYMDYPAFIAEYEASQSVDGVMEVGATASGTHYLAIGDVDVEQEDSNLQQYNTWYDVVAVIYNSSTTTTTMYKNGESGGGLGTLDSVTRKTGVQIGASKDGTKHFFKGMIAEIILYQRTLYAREREIVEKYLADKYAITKWTYKSSSFNVKDTSGYTYKIYFVGD